MRHLAAAALLALCALNASCSTDNSNSPSDTTTTTNPTQYTIKFGTTNNGLDVSACSVTVPGGLCSLVLTPNATTGVFHEVWAPNTPPLLTFDGTLTSTAVSATMKCANTAGTGLLSANINGTEYLGTATLAGRTIAVRVVKGNSPACP